MRRHATRNLEQIEDIMPFTPAALTFFRGLAKNNKKEWFEAHRVEYESEVREPMSELIGEMRGSSGSAW